MNYSDINKLALVCHSIAVEKGFWDASKNIPEKLMLIVSEVSEAMEEYRKVDYDPLKFQEELADVIIRIVDLAEHMNLNLAEAIEKKVEKNKGRSYLHGKRR